MTNTISEWDFETAVERTGYESIRSDYSGRGMYGRTCIGLVVTHDYAGRVRSELVQHAESLREEIDEADLDSPEDQVWADTQEELAEKIERLSESISEDSMGLDVIVYFPGWTFE